MQVDTLQKLLKEEQDKLVGLSKSDLNGERILTPFNNYIASVLGKLPEIEDSQELLDTAIQALRDIPGILGELINEARVTRREQSARVAAIRQCLETLENEVRLEEEERKRVEGLAESANADGEKPRKIGERPEQLKRKRKAEELKKEEQSKTD